MKGETALNLFLLAMPRLSVDIDVVMVRRDLARDDAIAAISDELDRARAKQRVMPLSSRRPPRVG